MNFDIFDPHFVLIFYQCMVKIWSDSPVVLVLKISFWHFINHLSLVFFFFKIAQKSMLFHQNCIHQYIFFSSELPLLMLESEAKFGLEKWVLLYYLANY